MAAPQPPRRRTPRMRVAVPPPSAVVCAGCVAPAGARAVGDDCANAAGASPVPCGVLWDGRAWHHAAGGGHEQRAGTKLKERGLSLKRAKWPFRAHNLRVLSAPAPLPASTFCPNSTTCEYSLSLDLHRLRALQEPRAAASHRQNTPQTPIFCWFSRPCPVRQTTHPPVASKDAEQCFLVPKQ